MSGMRWQCERFCSSCAASRILSISCSRLCRRTVTNFENMGLMLISFFRESISELRQMLLSGNSLLERLAQRSDELWAFERKAKMGDESILNFSGSLHADATSAFKGQLQSSGLYRRVSMANRQERETLETFA